MESLESSSLLCAELEPLEVQFSESSWAEKSSFLMSSIRKKTDKLVFWKHIKIWNTGKLDGEEGDEYLKSTQELNS